MSIRTVFLFLLSTILLINLFSCKKDSSILVDSELEWLKQNHTTTIAIFPYYPPYQFIDNHNSIEGIFIEYIDLIEKKIEHKFKKKYYSEWPELMDDLRANKIDLVFMDIKMPEMNGYDATRKIKVIKSKLPVIAQTTYSTKEDIQNAFAAGCDDFISKPVEPKMLKKILKKHLSISYKVNY